MNTWKKVLAIAAVVFTVGTASAKDELIAFSQLPKKAQTFVRAHFSEKDVSASLLEKEGLGRKEYTVVLNNGTKIEFDGKGKWEKVEVKTGGVPEKIVPTAILQHVRKNFPNTQVEEVKRSRKGYEVEISNGLELEFNKKGKFLRIDP